MKILQIELFLNSAHVVCLKIKFPKAVSFSVKYY